MDEGISEGMLAAMERSADQALRAAQRDVQGGHLVVCAEDILRLVREVRRLQEEIRMHERICPMGPRIHAPFTTGQIPAK